MEVNQFLSVEDYFLKSNGEKIETFFSQNYPKGSYKWIPSDSKESFVKNFKNFSQSDNPIHVKSLKYYRKNPITYDVNEVGFRDTPLSDKPKEVDVYLGCSHTFGIGHHIENTWVYKLQNFLNFPSINAAVPGAGIVTHFRMLVMLSQKFKIRNVFVFTDFNQPRLEWYYDALTLNGKTSRYRVLSATNVNVTEEDIENIFNNRNLSYLHLSFKYAFEGFCKNFNFNLFFTYFTDSNRLLRESKNNSVLPPFRYDGVGDLLARDFGHLSCMQQHYTYLYFLKLMGVEIFDKNYVKELET